MRIGRAPTPAERGMMAARENPELLDSLAENLHRARTGERWDGLSEMQREVWRVAALELQQEVIDTEPPPPPNGPHGGGEPIIERSA